VHQEKIDMFVQNRREYLRRWMESPIPEDIQAFLADTNRRNIMEAAERLVLYYRRNGIAITHRTLAQVLGISKSSLYRQYDRGLVRSALLHARWVAASPTQEDSQRKLRDQHPRLKRETYQQANRSRTRIT
jgi:hypothetical protein